MSKTTDLNDDSGRKCVEVKSTDGMWRQQPCSGLEVNYFVCEGKKIYSFNAQQDSGHSKGLSSGGKAGVAFGVIGGVLLCGAVGYFVYNKYRVPGAR